MNEKEKEAIEYLKSRLYGNEGCDYIDVAQEDLRIFINLVDRKEKDIEGWNKYCEEIEEERIEMSNKNCKLEFEVEKLQKENEELKENYVCAQANANQVFDILKNYIPVQKVKDKIEELTKEEQELQNSISKEEREEYSDANISYGLMNIDIRRSVLKELLEESEEQYVG